MCSIIRNLLLRVVEWLEERERNAVVRAGNRFYKRLHRFTGGNPAAIRQSLLHYFLTLEKRLTQPK